jgi:SAM-dependent methyltransferase
VSQSASYRVIDGVKCYHPDVAESYDSYPSAGFEVTDEVEDESFWVRSRLRLLRREILRLAKAASSPCRFLEIGCGTGLVLRSLVNETQMELLGSEIYLRGLQSARSHDSGVEFIQLDATAIPFNSEFDIIGAFDVIEHIDDDVAVLNGIRGALKPGGRLVITVPQHPFLWSRLDELVHHRRRYTRRELRKTVTGAGLKVEYVTSYFFTLFPLMLLSRLLERKQPDESADQALNRRVRFHPSVNKLFDAATRIDDLLTRLRCSLPWGGTLLMIAQRTD